MMISTEMLRKEFTKTDDMGRQTNPGVPDGFVSELPELSDEELTRDFYEAVACRNSVAAGLWPTAMYETWGVDPEVPEILRPIVNAAVAGSGLPEAQCCADYVEMDNANDMVTAIHNYARSQGWDIAVRYRLTDDDQIDFLGNVIQPFEFMTYGLTASMVKGGHEKWYWLHRRPEETIEEATGLAPAACTGYDFGAPTHAERPAWHGKFAGYVTGRAAMYYNGRGVDQKLRHAGLHVALWRVHAFVHTPRSCVEGFESGWRDAHEAGWPW